jgi:tRNA pseudouridine38-40 synthase
VLLTTSYDGSMFSGFVRQANARTVQQVLDGAVRALDPGASPTRCTSRTDAGVHAEAHPVAFDTVARISSRGWVLGLLQHLPEDVGIVRAERVPHGYDPRRHARSKTYRYAILRSPVRDPLFFGRAWRVGYKLDVERMRSAAQKLVGRHDFAAFRGSSDVRRDTVRHIFRVEVRTGRSDPRLCELEISGDGFLYNMVRIIAGTLVDIGRGRLAERVVLEAFESKSRGNLGVTAPAEGLYLAGVELAVRGGGGWPEPIAETGDA